MTQFSLHQLITEPTYVTEHSSSLLDLILVSNRLSVLFTDVGAPLLEQVRYHLPVIGLLHYSSKPSTSDTFPNGLYNLYVLLFYGFDFSYV
jgi:hypothetical protein